MISARSLPLSMLLAGIMIGLTLTVANASCYLDTILA
jgi:hypothetical protein